MTVYNDGMIVIKMENGACKRIVRDNVEGMFKILFYDTDGTADEILFLDESIEKEWKAIFVYLFDGQRTLLLYAHREMLPIVGVNIHTRYEMSYLGVRSEAFNVAALFEAGLVDKLISMERASKEHAKETTLLSVGGENEG